MKLSTWHERGTKKKIWAPEGNRTHDLPPELQAGALSTKPRELRESKVI